MTAVRNFRIRLKSSLISESLGRQTHATIFIANSNPPWKLFIISELKQLYVSNNYSLPDNKQLAKYFINRPEIDKKHQKKIMPFVMFSKDLLEKSGDIKSLDQHLSFNEYELLKTNQDYLRRILKIDQIDIQLIDHNQLDPSILPNLEDLSPGRPIIHYR
jgi:hypothetical protein